jgi:DNA-directed RNA polymerase specialized sigma24 family protein
VCHTIGAVLSLVQYEIGRSAVIPEQTIVDAFDTFVAGCEGRLRAALTATLGVEVGPDAAADALAHGWQNWDRVRSMDNPVGYLYKVGRDRGRKHLMRREPFIPSVPESRSPWIEPGLSPALAKLPERQRTVVMLVHGYEWTLAEVAEALSVSKSSVQTHHDRGMRKLRRKLGVGE